MSATNNQPQSPAGFTPLGGSEATCKDCGRKLRPAPAWRDGEETTVGYFACECSWTYYNDHIAGQGISYDEYREMVVAKTTA